MLAACPAASIRRGNHMQPPTKTQRLKRKIDQAASSATSREAGRVSSVIDGFRAKGSLVDDRQILGGCFAVVALAVGCWGLFMPSFPWLLSLSLSFPLLLLCLFLSFSLSFSLSLSLSVSASVLCRWCACLSVLPVSHSRMVCQAIKCMRMYTPFQCY